MADRQPAQLAWLALVCALALQGCDKTSPGGQAPPANADGEHPQAVAALDLNDWHAVHRDQAVHSINALVAATRSFLDQPTPENRELVQVAWNKAHNAYLALHFVTNNQAIQNRIDAWPVQPGFVDSLPAYPDSGIVNDVTLDITAESVRFQHQITDESEVALGFHILEYYAFARPLADFHDSAGNGSRRTAFVRVVMQQLASDMQALVADTRELAPQLTHQSLLALLGTRVTELIREFDQPGEHSEFCAPPPGNLRYQLGLLQEMLNETGLGHFLVDIDAEKAVQLDKTLTEVMRLAESDSLTPDTRERLAILLSGVSHQLAELGEIAG